jgi:hypothetical protein
LTELAHSLQSSVIFLLLAGNLHMSTGGFSSQLMHVALMTFKILAVILKQQNFLDYIMTQQKPYQSFLIAHARLRT